MLTSQRNTLDRGTKGNLNRGPKKQDMQASPSFDKRIKTLRIRHPIIDQTRQALSKPKPTPNLNPRASPTQQNSSRPAASRSSQPSSPPP